MGWEEIPVTVVDLDSGLWLVAERDENLERKDMTVSEMVALAKVLEIQIGKRQGARSDVKSRKDVQPSENGHSEKKSLINSETKPEKSGSELVSHGTQVEKGQKTREVIAKKAGFDSNHSLEMAKRIQELGAQALKEIVDDKAVSISDAAAICSEDHDTQTKAVSRVALRQAKTLKAAVAAIHAEQEDHGQADPVQDCNGINIPDNVREFYEEAKAFDEAPEIEHGILPTIDGLRLRIELVASLILWGALFAVPTAASAGDRFPESFVLIPIIVAAIVRVERDERLGNGGEERHDPNQYVRGIASTLGIVAGRDE